MEASVAAEAAEAVDGRSTVEFTNRSVTSNGSCRVLARNLYARRHD